MSNGKWDIEIRSVEEDDSLAAEGSLLARDIIGSNDLWDDNSADPVRVAWDCASDNDFDLDQGRPYGWTAEWVEPS